MRNFIIAVIILTVIIIFTVFNSIYICSICDDMIFLIDADNLQDAVTLWNENKDYISYFVHDSKIDTAIAESDTFGSDFRNKDDAEIKIRFREAICEIKDTEKSLPENIF